MRLAGNTAQLKAKLTQKEGKYLPSASVRKLMPAGIRSTHGILLHPG